MKHKALLVESSRLFQNVLVKSFESTGIECQICSTGKEAFEATHDSYTIIVCARTLDDVSGEVFLQKYGVEYGIGTALPILLTANDVSEVQEDALKSGYKLVLNKKKCRSTRKLYQPCSQ